MDLFEVIKERHSYRGAYSDDTVPREDLKRIVAAGLAAPSGCNAQTTRFVIVDDPGKLAAIGALHTMPAMQQAKAMICVVTDREPEPVYQGMSFQVEDCSAATENMLLAITALGYASVWIDGWLRAENRAELIGNMLDIPKDKVLRIVLPVGVPTEEAPRREKMPFSERAWFNAYGD